MTTVPAMSVEEIRLLARDHVPERLEPVVARNGRADLTVGLARHLVVDENWGSGGLGEQLRLAGTLHRDERPHRCVDRMSDREESVVAQDHGLVVAERGADALALLYVEDDAG